MSDPLDEEAEREADFDAIDRKLVQAFRHGVFAFDLDILTMEEAAYDAERRRRKLLLIESVTEDLVTLVELSATPEELARAIEWSQLRDEITRQLKGHE